MVGVRTLKHCSVTLFLFGVAVLSLSYKWFFDQHVLHPHRATYHFQQLNLPPDIRFPLQNGETVISKDVVPSVHLPKASVMERPPQEHNEQQHVLNSVANQRNSHPQVQSEHSQKANPNENNSQSGHNNNPVSDSKKDAPETSESNASDKSKDSPTAEGKKSEIEKKIAERIVSRNQKTRGKHPLRSEDHFIENRGPDGATRKVDVRRLHRSFSLAALKSGNVYTTEDNQPGARVIHVAVFVKHGAFTALMTLVNSVVKNTHFRNVTFHFVTSSETDRMRLKSELGDSRLSTIPYEIIEYPAEWSQGKNLLEFAPFRLPEILPYMGGRVIILDPYCLVKGDISELAEMHISRGHYAAMATLCNADPASDMPEERYRHYLNFSHEAIAKLHLSPDTCVPSPAVMVTDINVIRLANIRRQMWHWMHLCDKTPVFLRTAEDGMVSSKAPYTVVYHNHTTLLKPLWYTRVSEQSPVSDTDHFLYHWVGKGKPWESSSPVSAIWNAFLVRSTDDSG